MISLNQTKNKIIIKDKTNGKQKKIEKDISRKT